MALPTPSSNDTRLDTLQKILLLVLSLPGMSTTVTPNSNDTIWTVEQKILRALIDYANSGAGSGVQHGNGDPNGVVTGSLGSIYTQDDLPGTIWVNTDGGTTWVVAGSAALPPIIGAGDPNGVVLGTLGQFFIDMANPGHLYINMDGATGWNLNA